MNKSEKLTLIEGTFSPEDAKEMVLNIFLTKINFHEIKNFSSQERFGKTDENSIKRIPELNRGIERTLQIVADAKANKRQLIITSEINITISDN